VYPAELEEKVPALWASVQAADSLRRALRRPVEIIGRLMEIAHVPERLLLHHGRRG
jgi:hypothetical protein